MPRKQHQSGPVVIVEYWFALQPLNAESDADTGVRRNTCAKEPPETVRREKLRVVWMRLNLFWRRKILIGDGLGRAKDACGMGANGTQIPVRPVLGYELRSEIVKHTWRRDSIKPSVGVLEQQ